MNASTLQKEQMRCAGSALAEFLNFRSELADVQILFGLVEVQCQIWVHNTIKHLFVSGNTYICFCFGRRRAMAPLFWMLWTIVVSRWHSACTTGRHRLGLWWLWTLLKLHSDSTCFQSPQVPNDFGDVARNSGFPLYREIPFIPSYLACSCISLAVVFNQATKKMKNHIPPHTGLFIRESHDGDFIIPKIEGSSTYTDYTAQTSRNSLLNCLQHVGVDSQPAQ